MARWPADNEAALIEYYGTPKSHELESQMVDVVPPFKMYYEGKPVEKIKFHRKAAPALRAAFKEIWDKFNHDQGAIDAAHVSVYSGAYNPRYIGNTTKWSNHAFGAAIDLDAERNSQTTDPVKGRGEISQIVIDAFKRQGARWGGDYQHSRKDPMHFEFAGGGEIITPWARDREEEPSVQANIPQAQVPSAQPPSQPHPDELRFSMAKTILDFEARRDRDGHLEVYKLPPSDGGGTYEVAGINDRYNKPVADQLVALIKAGSFDEAERMAEQYILKNTQAATQWSSVPALEFFFRDCTFNRGPAGAVKIIQLACGFSGDKNHPDDVDGIWGPKTEAALREKEKNAPAFLAELRKARERYERDWVGYRAVFWKGLVNRWNNALGAAMTFPFAPAPALAQAPPPAPLGQERPQVRPAQQPMGTGSGAPPPVTQLDEGQLSVVVYGREGLLLCIQHPPTGTSISTSPARADGARVREALEAAIKLTPVGEPERPAPSPAAEAQPKDEPKASAPTIGERIKGMAWKIGSGLGSLLLKRVLGSKSFETAATNAVKGIGERGLAHIHAPDQLKIMFDNLVDHAPSVVGAIVKGTEAQSLVTPTTVKAADEIKSEEGNPAAATKR